MVTTAEAEPLSNVRTGYGLAKPLLYACARASRSVPHSPRCSTVNVDTLWRGLGSRCQSTTYFPTSHYCGVQSPVRHVGRQGPTGPQGEGASMCSSRQFEVPCARRQGQGRRIAGERRQVMRAALPSWRDSVSCCSRGSGHDNITREQL